MTETKFTPGPWDLDVGFEGSSPGDFEEYWQVHDGHDAIACSANCYAGNGEANAHLIAAAPELYEALSSVMNEIGSCLADEIYYFGTNEPFNLARAALAKARGES